MGGAGKVSGEKKTAFSWVKIFRGPDSLEIVLARKKLRNFGGLSYLFWRAGQKRKNSTNFLRFGEGSPINRKRKLGKTGKKVSKNPENQSIPPLEKG
jgi:hypothetical protein